MPSHCTQPTEAGIIHMLDVHSTHLSASSNDWGSTQDWESTTRLVDMVHKHRDAAARGTNQQKQQQ